MESLRKDALYKIYQQKRRMVIGSGGHLGSPSSRGMDYERNSVSYEAKDFASLSQLTIKQLDGRDYAAAAETVAKIRILFSTNLQQLDFDGLDECGIIPELINRIGVDMLSTCPSIISDSLQ